MIQGGIEIMLKFTFFFTHCNENEDLIRAKLKDLRANLTATEQANQLLVKFIEVMIHKAEKGEIRILRPLDKNPLAIHLLIKETESI